MNISKSLYHNKLLQWCFVYLPALVFVIGNIVKTFWDYSDRFYNLVINDISLGFLSAFLFYYVLVYMPLARSRYRIKLRLQESFLDFKKNVIALLLQAGEIKLPDIAEADRLLSIDEFKIFFSGSDGGDVNRWQIVQQGLANNPVLVEDISAELVFLKEEMLVALGHVDVPNDQVFDLVKDVSLLIYKYKNKCVRSDSDNLKWFTALLWQIFTGYPWIAGEQKKENSTECCNKVS